MLRDLQMQLMNGLLSAGTGKGMLHYISADNEAAAAEQLAIYRDSMVGGLTEALAEIYPVINKLVGEKFFNALASRYIDRYPSVSPALDDYGEKMASFISSFPSAVALPYLADVARLEWAWHCVFNAIDTISNITLLDTVAEPDQPYLIFGLPETSSLLESAFPVHRIWQVNQDDYEGDQQVDLDEGGVRLLIHRHDLSMCIDIVEQKESWVFLQLLSQQQPFAFAHAQFSARYPDRNISELLGECLQKHWIVSFTLQEEK